MITTPKGYQYPEETDTVTTFPAAAAVTTLLNDARPGISVVSTTARNAYTGIDLWDGRIVWNTTTQRLEKYDLGTTTWIFAVPTATTQAPGDNTLAIATDAFVLANAVQPSHFGASGKNVIINGGMDVWQRGTSFNAVNALVIYTTDRWSMYSGAAAAGGFVASQVTSPALAGYNYALRIQRPSGATDLGVLYLAQGAETANSLPFAGQTVTLSFWARAGANFSAASSALAVSLKSGTGVDQNPITTYTGAVNVLSSTATLTTSWQRFTYTATVASTVTELGAFFTFSPTGTAGAADYFDITGVQLELGSVATPFSRAGGSIGGELALCQRYYYKINSANASDGYCNYATGQAFTSTQASIIVPFPVTMRAAPSFSSSVASGIALNSANGSVLALTSIGLSRDSVSSALVTPIVAGGLVAGNGTTLYSNSNNTSYLAFSAEL